LVRLTLAAPLLTKYLGLDAIIPFKRRVTLSDLDAIAAHLGGKARLKALGATLGPEEGGHFSLRFTRANPQGVRSIDITGEPGGLFGMTCYGPVAAEALHAPQLGHATGILPENLATVIGRLTGIETLHHHHY
jgi:hypothetical protein